MGLGLENNWRGQKTKTVLEIVPSGICWESLEALSDGSLVYFIVGSRTKRAGIPECCGDCVVGRRLQMT